MSYQGSLWMAPNTQQIWVDPPLVDLGGADWTGSTLSSLES